MSHAFTAAVTALLPTPNYVSRAPAEANTAGTAYTVFHPPEETTQEDDLAGAFDHEMHRFVIAAVSNSEQGAQDLNDEIKAALVNVVLTVAGRKFSPLRYQGLGVRVDESLLTPLYEARSMWSCMSVPS